MPEIILRKRVVDLLKNNSPVKDFVSGALNFAGCDGGNIRAKTWLCGIEWGGGADKREDDFEYYQNQLLKDLRDFELKTSSNIWGDVVKFTYGRKLAQLISAVRTGEICENPRETAENWDGEEQEIFKLNLYPIPFRSTDPTFWDKNQLTQITGFTDKHTYMIWCYLNRFPTFFELMSEHQPELIICTGITYFQEFLKCFASGQLPVLDISMGHVVDVGFPANCSPRRYFWTKVGETWIVIIPFPTGQYGLNSGSLLAQMGREIRKIIDT